MFKLNHIWFMVIIYDSWWIIYDSHKIIYDSKKIIYIYIKIKTSIWNNMNFWKNLQEDHKLPCTLKHTYIQNHYYLEWPWSLASLCWKPQHKNDQMHRSRKTPNSTTTKQNLNTINTCTKNIFKPGWVFTNSKSKSDVEEGSYLNWASISSKNDFHCSSSVRVPLIIPWFCVEQKNSIKKTIKNKNTYKCKKINWIKNVQYIQ